jgi:hypothetical protein
MSGMRGVPCAGPGGGGGGDDEATGGGDGVPTNLALNSGML